MSKPEGCSIIEQRLIPFGQRRKRPTWRRTGAGRKLRRSLSGHHGESELGRGSQLDGCWVYKARPGDRWSGDWRLLVAGQDRKQS
ncbi:hypothetical protein N657DRAFT_640424 [Parathielavia appendiculata]|uniref:Uncharacterized protein n=1 Tax=Parathielavia appendiculata TaxID=2587402 RepID=A0AAN6Z9Z7_9PEZI|nr:hypothetical protein N657DRAFT_640424 [Parathielavia appendiculata]